MDLFDLIKADYEEIIALFTQLWESGQPPDAREEMFKQLDTLLRLHADAEAAIFYPPLREGDLDTELLDECDDDHRFIAELLDEVATKPIGSRPWTDTMEIIQEGVVEHIEAEEHFLFAMARQLFTPAELSDMAERWQAFKQKRRAQR